MIAVNVNDDPQVFQLGVSTEFRRPRGEPTARRRCQGMGDFVAPDGPREQPGSGAVVRPERS